MRDEADIIITNPPFSLFREFVAWILEANKQFLIIGNMNAITYKETFKYIKENRLWLGNNAVKQFIFAGTKEQCNKNITEIDGVLYADFGNVIWFTNLEHNKRHQPMHFMTVEENLKYNKKDLPNGYEKYDNYDAIEVPKVGLIPSDYDGVMGVPITYLGNHNPEEFEIVAFRKGSDGKDLVFTRERESISILQGAHTKNLREDTHSQQRVWCQVWRLEEKKHIEDCWLGENDMIYHSEPCIEVEKLKKNPTFVSYPSRQIAYKGKLCQKTYHRFFIMKKSIINDLLNKK